MQYALGAAIRDARGRRGGRCLGERLPGEATPAAAEKVASHPVEPMARTQRNFWCMY